MKALTNQRVLLVFLGLFLLAIGVFGFLSENNTLFGIFHINATINIIHIITALICFHSAWKDCMLPASFFGNPTFRMKGKQSIPVVFLKSEDFVFGFAVIYKLIAFGELIYGLIDWMRFGLDNKVNPSITVSIFAMGALHIFLVIFITRLNNFIERDLNN